MIPFNKPHLTGREQALIREAADRGKLSANGLFTQRCQALLGERYGVERCFLTTSCTSALEMAALIYGIGPGDEVIVPSFTFVSTALAFTRAGARVRFADSLPRHPNLDCSQLEALITPRTRAIVPVHYGGVLCDMERIFELADRHRLHVIEDAAHTVAATPRGRRGMSCVSFHETKNIHCGEGGMLGVNEPELIARAETIWNRGTNRSAFERGEVPSYEWVSQGASFAPNELTAAFLCAQLEAAETIQHRRRTLWNHYLRQLQPLAEAGCFELPADPGSAHIFYLVCCSKAERDALIRHLAAHNILAVFHYQSLHRSPYGALLHDGRELPCADRFSDCLLRLPLFHELAEQEIETIADSIRLFFKP